MRFCVSYNRVSSEQQVQGASLSQQQQAAQQFVSMRGARVVAQVSDQGTGANLERDGVAQVMEMLRMGTVDTVLFHKVDRVGREQGVYAQFWGGIYTLGGKVGITTMGKVWDSYETLMRDTVFDRAVGERELYDIRDRTQSGIEAHLENGSWMNKPIYGYRLVTVKENGMRLKLPEPDPEQIQVVLWIFEMYLEGKSASAVCKALNEAGIPSPNRKKWLEVTMHRTISRASMYAGQPFTLDRKVRGVPKRVVRSYPAIITHEMAQQIEQRRHTRSRGKSTPGLLRGLGTCSCGRPLTPMKYYGKKKTFRMTHFVGCASRIRSRNYRGLGVDVPLSSCQHMLSSARILEKLQTYLEGDIYEDAKKLVMKERVLEALTRVEERDQQRLQEEMEKLEDRLLEVPNKGEFTTLLHRLESRMHKLHLELEEKAKVIRANKLAQEGVQNLLRMLQLPQEGEQIDLILTLESSRGWWRGSQELSKAKT